MPNYKVLRQIEHDGKIYFPAGTEGVPKSLPSGAHGKDAPTDCSGTIALTEEQAKALDLSQVAPPEKPPAKKK